MALNKNISKTTIGLAIAASIIAPIAWYITGWADFGNNPQKYNNLDIFFLAVPVALWAIALRTRYADQSNKLVSKRSKKS